jgi:hypothetical protein
VLTIQCLSSPEGSSSTKTTGNMANSVMTVRVNLTAFDSSSQTYRSTCTVGRTIPPMTDNTPAVYGEAGALEM